MGVVYYANYLVWFEIGRTDFCRKHGFAYREMEQQDGLYIMVAEARCRYKAPARYDDEILVRTCLKATRRRVLIFGYEVYRQPPTNSWRKGKPYTSSPTVTGIPVPCPTKYPGIVCRDRDTGPAAQ